MGGIGRTRLRGTGWYSSFCFFSDIHAGFPSESRSGGIARGYGGVGGTGLPYLRKGGTCTLRYSLGGERSQCYVSVTGRPSWGGQ